MLGSGTGSNPDGPNGRQRRRRRSVSQEPRPVPCTTSASLAYDEHDGVNRHGDGRPSNARWYRRRDGPGEARCSLAPPCAAAPSRRRPIHRTSVRSAPAARRAVVGREGRGPIRRGPRRSARSRRRSRLRATALPSARPTEKATAGGLTAGSPRYRHQRVSVVARRPWRCSRSNARRSWIRPIKPTDASGP